MVTEAIDPIAVTFKQATKISAISRSELYRRCADGHIAAVKSGRSSLILLASLREHIASLPAANFKSAA